MPWSTNEGVWDTGDRVLSSTNNEPSPSPSDSDTASPPPPVARARKRGRGPPAARPEEQDVDEDEVGVEEYAAGGGGGGGGGEEDGIVNELMDKAVEKAKLEIGKTVYESKVHSLVRLALFWEYKRQPLRRDDINKKVLEKSTKYFKPILHSSQRLLRTRFGMELVELRSKGLGAGSQALAGGSQLLQPTQGAAAKKKTGPARKKRRGDVNEDEEEIEDEADDSAAVPTQTQGVREKTPTATSRSYTLRSTLPPSLLSLLTIPKPLHTDPESDGLSSGGGGTQRFPDCGAIIDVDNGDGQGGVGLIGLLWVILGIVLVHDRSIRDDALRKILKNKLLIEPTTLLPFTSPSSPSPPPTFDTFLKLLTKQGYLEQVKGTNAAVMRLNGDGGAVTDMEWRWGARADAEIGERAVGEFMADLHATQQFDDEDDDNVANARSNRRGVAPARPVETKQTRRKKLMNAIEKASGGELMK